MYLRVQHPRPDLKYDAKKILINAIQELAGKDDPIKIFGLSQIAFERTKLNLIRFKKDQKNVHIFNSMILQNLQRAKELGLTFMPYLSKRTRFLKKTLGVVRDILHNEVPTKPIIILSINWI